MAVCDSKLHSTYFPSSLFSCFSFVLSRGTLKWSCWLTFLVLAHFSRVDSYFFSLIVPKKVFNIQLVQLTSGIDNGGFRPGVA